MPNQRHGRAPRYTITLETSTIRCTGYRHSDYGQSAPNRNYIRCWLQLTHANFMHLSPLHLLGDAFFSVMAIWMTDAPPQNLYDFAGDF